jgi:flagellar hook protein FlgE
MLEKLFESLDENVFTAELKESLEAQFNEAVEAKAAIIADEKIEEATDSLNEKSEAHIDFLNEKADQYVAQKQSEMVDSLDKYLDRVVEEFVSEAKDALNESVKSEKADMIIEAFDSMLTATGVEVAKIVEAKDDSAVENKLEESVEKYDSLVEELIALKDENETLIKMGVISELKEGLSIVEAEKFVKLAGLVEFTKDEAFAEKLETIKESVKGAVEAKEEELTETVDQDGESKEAPAWAHLV